MDRTVATNGQFRGRLWAESHGRRHPCSDYYGSSAHLGSINRRQVFPPTSRLLAGEGTAVMVPTFTLEPINGVDAQLCPCNLATPTPQPFSVASPPATSPSPRVPRHNNNTFFGGVSSAVLPEAHR